MTGTSSAKIDLNVIKIIESSGIADAQNTRTGARGLWQITPICLKDFNKHTKSTYTYNDLWAPWINRKIADWYLHKRIPQILRSRKKKLTVDNLLISYNAGHSWIGKRLPKETQEYLRKYRRLTK